MTDAVDIDETIKASNFKVHADLYIYGSVSETPSLEDCFMLSRDQDEVTAVVEEQNALKVKFKEQNKDLRKLIELKVSVPFYAVGFLATVSSVIANAGCNCLVVSTYSKDYVLVTEQQFEEAKTALITRGFTEEA